MRALSVAFALWAIGCLSAAMPVRASYPVVSSVVYLAGGNSSVACPQPQNVAVDESTGEVLVPCGDAYRGLPLGGGARILPIDEQACPIVEAWSVSPDTSILVAGCMFGSAGTLALALNDSTAQPLSLTNNTFATAAAAFPRDDRILLAKPLVFPPQSDASLLSVSVDGSSQKVLAWDGECSNPPIALDVNNDVLWVVCNHSLAIMDSHTGAITKRVPVPPQLTASGLLTVQFVPASGRLYVFNVHIPAYFLVGELDPATGQWRVLRNNLTCAGSTIFAETPLPSFLFLACDNDAPDAPALIAVDIHLQSDSVWDSSRDSPVTTDVPYVVLLNASVCNNGGAGIVSAAWRPQTSEVIMSCPLQGLIAVKLDFDEQERVALF